MSQKPLSDILILKETMLEPFHHGWSHSFVFSSSVICTVRKYERTAALIVLPNCVKNFFVFISYLCLIWIHWHKALIYDPNNEIHIIGEILIKIQMTIKRKLQIHTSLVFTWLKNTWAGNTWPWKSSAPITFRCHLQNFFKITIHYFSWFILLACIF